MRLYVRTSRSTGVSLGLFSLAVLSPFLVMWWLVAVSWLTLKWLLIMPAVWLARFTVWAFRFTAAAVVAFTATVRERQAERHHPA
jgi:hypothetical protein